MLVLCGRCEWCELQPVPEPGAAEGLADGLSGELQAEHRMWGHRYRGRSYAALHSSLQVLTGECLLPPTLVKRRNVSPSSASTLRKDFGKWQISQQLFPFLSVLLSERLKRLNIMRLVWAFQQHPYVCRALKRQDTNTSPSHFNNLLFQHSKKKHPP